MHWSSTPRVTLGIATWNRDTYLAEAIESGLNQTYDDYELLLVDDGSTNPRIAEVLARYADEPRLRVVRHAANRGIAAGYNTMVTEGRGELIAMIGDDDVCLPDRLARSVAVFDRYPETGVVHGDAAVIDGQGATTGQWTSRDFTPAALVQAFYRSHNHLVDPSRMVHRRVYDRVGGYDGDYKVAQDLHFWLRAAREFRFRHVPGGPLVRFRRHGANTSDESARTTEIADVERILEDGLERYSLRELVPELDWAVLDPDDAERQALERLASHVERRLLPLPGLAASLRARAGDRSRIAGTPKRAPRNGRRLMMTAFGWNDSGGGTIVPRLAARELARRGWDVTVFHAAVKPTADRIPYEVREWDEDGVHLIGVHNRAHGLWDLTNPARELDDPPITAAFAAALERVDPHVVHFHNLHNLGAALIDVAAARGVPSWFTTHNYWLLCPRAYLMNGGGAICDGPGDGARCAACVGSAADPDGHVRRLSEIRARATRGLTAVMAVSDAVRRTLLGAGYPAEMVSVVRQGMPHDTEIWERLGRSRTPGRVAPDALTVAFLGSAYPHKGPQLLVEAAQRTEARLRVQIHGEVPARFDEALRAMDRRGVVELCGSFAPSEIERVLAGVDVAALPSIWWDCAPLAAAECRAAGVPLVVPRLGGLAEAARDEVDGLVFDALDAGDLARQLDRLASEPGLLERLQGGIEAPRAFADYVNELEAYYAGERPPAGDDRRDDADLAITWSGNPSAPLARAFPARVRRAGTADEPLPHAADVELRDAWPPDVSAPASGRLVVLVPADAGPDDLSADVHGALAVNADELWVADSSARERWVGAGVPDRRVVVAPEDPVARLRALAAHVPNASDPANVVPRVLEEDVLLRVLATPAWRSSPTNPDRLAELLARWCAATREATSACLYLLADPAVDGTPEELEARVLGAVRRGGARLDGAGDINLMMEPFEATRDAALHAAMTAYVPLHAGCAGHERLARATGSEVISLDGDGLAKRLVGLAERAGVAAAGTR